jgi:hypothetical protein
VVGDLVAERPVDLDREPLGVVAEVPQECVAVDHDLIDRVVAGDAVAVIEPVGVRRPAAVEDDDRNGVKDLEHPVGESIEGVGDELLDRD